MNIPRDDMNVSCGSRLLVGGQERVGRGYIDMHLFEEEVPCTLVGKASTIQAATRRQAREATRFLRIFHDQAPK